MTYEAYVSDYGTEFIKRNNEDGSISFIPVDDANPDYQAYVNKDNPDYGKPPKL